MAKKKKPEMVLHQDGRLYERHGLGVTREEMTHKLTCHRYGVMPERILSILNKLTDDELEDLMYTCYRVADKCGAGHFDTSSPDLDED